MKFAQPCNGCVQILSVHDSNFNSIFSNSVQLYFNPFVPNGPFLYLLKTSENHKVFCLQGV